MASPAPAHPHRFLVLLIKLGALAAAGGAQTVVRTQPWLSIGGFALGILFFIVAERLVPPTPEPAADPPPPAPNGCWWLLGIGCTLCLTAGILVQRSAPPTTTEPLWLFGLLLLIASAVRSWRSAGSVPRPTRMTLGTLLLLFVIAGGLFGWRVTTIPPEVHNDEAEIGNDAVRLVDSRPLNLFTTGWYELPMFHALPTAVGVSLFGANLLGLRSPSITFGVVSVLLVFGLAYALWDFDVALLSGLLLASQRYFIHLSRTGYIYIDTPFYSLLVVWLFVRVWRAGGLGAAVWCGIALGLGMQTYYASRLIPVLLALTWLLWVSGADRGLLRARGARFLVIVVTAFAAAAPMVGYFWNRWEALWARTRGTSVFTEASIHHLSYGYGTRDLGQILLIQAEKALTLFNKTGDTSVQYGYLDGGLFEPVSAALFVLGFAAACARPLQRRNFLLLSWIVIPVIAGAALTIDTPFYPRISGIVPFAVLVVAVALHSLFESLRAVVPGAAGRVVTAALALAVLGVVFTNNIRTYFIDYAPHHRHSPAVEISNWISAHGAGKTTYMVGGAPGFFIAHATIRFLTHGYATRDIDDLDTYAQHHHLDPATSLFIIMPQGHNLVPKLTDIVGPLDIEEHRNIHNDVHFYTGVPRAVP